MSSAEYLYTRATPVPEAGCWLWMGGANSSGYGAVQVNGRTVGAHRRSYELAYGPIPDGLNVCHKCDVRLCVNPRHLFLGTDADNLADRNAKGRANAPKGSRHWLYGNSANHPMRKLDPAAVRKIRLLYLMGMTQVALAKRFSVRQTTISNIVRRQTWAA